PAADVVVRGPWPAEFERIRDHESLSRPSPGLVRASQTTSSPPARGTSVFRLWTGPVSGDYSLIFRVSGTDRIGPADLAGPSGRACPQPDRSSADAPSQPTRGRPQGRDRLHRARPGPGLEGEGEGRRRTGDRRQPVPQPARGEGGRDRGDRGESDR